MKAIKLLGIIALFALISCGSNKTKETEVEGDIESIVDEVMDTEVDDEAKNCKEFVDKYEKWMDSYLDLLEKYMKNPLDTELLTEYTKVSQEALTWYHDWTTKMVYCASKEKYQKRFDEIAEKAEKKMKELGIE